MLTTSINSLVLAASAVAGLSATSAANAAIDIHVTGSSWGVWITGLFSASPNVDGSTHYAQSDGGSGVPMDFMMDLPDGTAVNGADVTMRMISADISGSVGDDQVELSSWSLWVTGSNWGVHVIWDSAASPLALDNLGSSGKDGVRYFAGGFDEALAWTFERPDGTVQSFTTNFDSFEFVAPIPAPGAAALFGLAGMTTARRRRRA